MVEGSTFTLGGMAKGCGMIAPNMATMLAFLTTDAEVAARRAAARSCATPSDRTFNTLNVDGATSTNDTVDPARLRPARPARPGRVRRRRAQACEDLTLQMARDAEGMTKMVALAGHRRGQRRRGAGRRQEHRREQSGQMLLARRRSLLGPAARRGRIGRGRLRHREERRSPMAASIVVARRHRCRA